jgi:hypothetical protein
MPSEEERIKMPVVEAPMLAGYSGCLNPEHVSIFSIISSFHKPMLQATKPVVAPGPAKAFQSGGRTTIHS